MTNEVKDIKETGIDGSKIKNAIVICFTSLCNDLSLHHYINVYYPYEGKLRKLNGYCDNNSLGKDFEHDLKLQVSVMFDDLVPDSNIRSDDIILNHFIDDNVDRSALSQIELNTKRMRKIL